MTREWQPGDVALWKYLSAERVALRVQGCAHDHSPGQHWHLSNGGWTVGDEVSLRPLVVIDPEDREQVERLVWAQDDAFKAARPFAWQEADEEPEDHTLVEEMQAALRSIITQPKPDEPLGLGALVKDVEGEYWVRMAESPAWVTNEFLQRNWDEIKAVRVLSEGVVTND